MRVEMTLKVMMSTRMVTTNMNECVDDIECDDEYDDDVDEYE